jgi:hypothetical protein
MNRLLGLLFLMCLILGFSYIGGCGTPTPKDEQISGESAVQEHTPEPSAEPYQPDSHITDAGTPEPIADTQELPPQEQPPKEIVVDGGEIDTGKPDEIHTPDTQIADKAIPEPKPEEVVIDQPDEQPIDSGAPDQISTEYLPPDQFTQTSLSGTIRRLIQSGNPTIANVKVCIDQYPQIPCVTSNSKGAYTITGAPIGPDLYFTYTATDLWPTMLDLNLSDGQPYPALDVNLLTTLEATVFGSLVGATPDPTKAHIAINVHQNQGGMMSLLSDVKVSISPSSGAGPYYPTAQNTFDPNGTSAIGLAVFFNVNPGQVTISCSHSSLKCQAASHRIKDTKGLNIINLKAGWLYFVGSECR